MKRIFDEDGGDVSTEIVRRIRLSDELSSQLVRFSQIGYEFKNCSMEIELSTIKECKAKHKALYSQSYEKQN